MSNVAAAQFTGDIPRFYDKHLGPVIFESYAADLARRAAAAGGTDVLEIAAGTGISTLALRAALPHARLIATDLNDAMIEIARAKFAPSANVDFRQADAMALPFADAAFDLVVIQFGVMFFPDKPAAFAEARRVLRPGGTLIFNAWGTMAANPFAEICNAAAHHFLPDNPPKFYLTPFGYADIERAKSDVREGGFAQVDHDAVRVDTHVNDWDHFAQGATFGNPMIVDLRAGGVDPSTVAAWIAAQLRERFGEAPARMPLEATVYTVRKR